MGSCFTSIYDTKQAFVPRKASDTRNEVKLARDSQSGQCFRLIIWPVTLFQLDRERLSLERQGQFYKLYDPTVNPELINSVPTAALRMGHTLVRNTFILRNSRFGSSGFGQTGRQIPVADFYIPAPLFEEGNNPFGGIALGLTESRGQAVDGYVLTWKNRQTDKQAGSTDK